MSEFEGRRRRADSPLVAGSELMLQHPSGAIARIAVVIDQLDDDGYRTPLVEDVLAAFPHGEVHVVDDRRARPGAAIAGRIPTCHAVATPRRRLFRRPPTDADAAPRLDDVDVVLRIGDRRVRGFTTAADTLDLTYILALDGSEEPGSKRLGPSLRDRCALHSSDVVWCASHSLMRILRQRWNVEANMLYPPAHLAAAPTRPGAKTLVVAVDGDHGPGWTARLATLARVRRDLTVVAHGGAADRRSRHIVRSEPSAERFRELLPEALAVIMPPGDTFDPRSVWAQDAGVPVIAPLRGAAGETVEGLERRAPTGMLLDELTDDALLDAVGFIEHHRELFRAETLKRQAARWSPERFRGTLKSLVLDAWCRHVARFEPVAVEPTRQPRAEEAVVPF